MCIRAERAARPPSGREQRGWRAAGGRARRTDAGARRTEPALTLRGELGALLSIPHLSFLSWAGDTASG